MDCTSKQAGKDDLNDLIGCSNQKDFKMQEHTNLFNVLGTAKDNNNNKT